MATTPANATTHPSAEEPASATGVTFPAPDLTSKITLIPNIVPLRFPNSDIFHGTLEEDGKPSRHVAIKYLRVADRNGENGPIYDLALKKEARILTAVEHPHINPILGTFMYERVGPPKETNLCIVTPWISGGDLSQWLKRDSTPSIEQRRKVLGGIAHALFHLHTSNPQLLHGDIHPANVLIGPDDCALLTDFGLCKIADKGEVSLTANWGDTRPGSQPYLAPELTDENQRRTPSTDGFAFGCLAWVVFTGKRPFGTYSASAVQTDHLATLEPRRVDIPPDLWKIITSSMSKDPASRPTMREILSVLAPDVELPPPTGNELLAEAPATQQASLPLARDVYTGVGLEQSSVAPGSAHTDSWNLWTWLGWR